MRCLSARGKRQETGEDLILRAVTLAQSYHSPCVLLTKWQLKQGSTGKKPSSLLRRLYWQLLCCTTTQGRAPPMPVQTELQLPGVALQHPHRSTAQ